MRRRLAEGDNVRSGHFFRNGNVNRKNIEIDDYGITLGSYHADSIGKEYWGLCGVDSVITKCGMKYFSWARRDAKVTTAGTDVRAWAGRDVYVGKAGGRVRARAKRTAYVGEAQSVKVRARFVELGDIGFLEKCVCDVLTISGEIEEFDLDSIKVNRYRIADGIDKNIIPEALREHLDDCVEEHRYKNGLDEKKIPRSRPTDA